MLMNAHAKINLCLNVVAKRDDGYHELEMIMVPLQLHDVIQVELANEDSYTCTQKDLAMDEHNTVVKAVELMRTTFKLKEHFKIHVEKNIPSQAGLAGGSADGAGVLRAIRSLCHIDISMEELSLLGKQIGADVPFCVMQCCAVVKGIGEKITPFENHCDFDILLVKPKEGVPTGKAFSMLDFTKCAHPDCDVVKSCLKQGNFIELSQCVSNSLEYSAFQIVPHIKAIKEELIKKGFEVVLMSGSGSTVFALTRNHSLLDRTMNDYHDKDYFVCKTHIYEPCTG